MNRNRFETLIYMSLKFYQHIKSIMKTQIALLSFQSYHYCNGPEYIRVLHHLNKNELLFCLH